MGADPNIFQAYLQPPKSIIDYQNQYAQADQLRNQNALSSLVLQQKGMEVGQAATAQNALQRIASGWNANTTPDQRVADLRNSGIPQLMTQADALETQGLARTKTEADAAKANADAGKTTTETGVIRHQQHLQALSTVNTPEDAMNWIVSGVQSGALPKEGLAQALQRLQVASSTPDGLSLWKAQTQQSGQTIQQQMEMTTPKPTEMRLGNVVKTIDMNPHSATFGKEVVGQQAVGVSPDTAATNATSRANNRDTINAETTRAGATLAETSRHNQATETGKAPMTEAQAKAYGFGTRMQESDRLLTQLAKDGAERPGNIKSALEATPLIGGGLGAAANWTQSPNQQSVEQAQRDFVNAVLRRESGAAINESEFVSARKQYFPQIGDSDQVKAQKAANRRLAIQGVMAEVPGGKGAAPAPAAAPNVLHFDANGNLVS